MNPYYPNMAWLVIKSIVKLIKFSPSLTCGLPSGSCFDLIPFESKGGAFRKVLCFNWEALFPQHGMAHHQKHCQAYQVLSLDGSPSSSISSLNPSPPEQSGLDFGIRSFEHFPFGPSPTTFIHAHPFHYSMGGVACFSASF
jgi:hypothetical protein